MKKLCGKFAEAYVYADMIDHLTETQIQLLLDQEFMKDHKVRIMADCHAGEGCVIGTTFKIKDKVVPNLVGVDIGCGMLVVKLGKIDIDFAKLDAFIHEKIPSGMRVNETISKSIIQIEDLKCFSLLKNACYLKMSMGSLGGGNHFIEIDKNKDGELYLIIHTGSRNLGKQVAEIYQKKAIEYHKNKVFNKKEVIQNIIQEYKSLGREKEIEDEIKNISCRVIHLPMPETLCYLEGTLFEDYMFDMNICQKFASENRFEVAKRITQFLNLDVTRLVTFETIHNYINMKDKILRKGSISAYENEIVLIPINMRDGCIIGKGRSNPEYNFSAPHGAGRVLSRSKALQTIQLSDFQEAMKGVYSSTVNAFTLDESPFVYKPLETIVKNIKDTIDIVEILQPIYNFKAAE